MGLEEIPAKCHKCKHQGRLKIFLVISSTETRLKCPRCGSHDIYDTLSGFRPKTLIIKDAQQTELVL